VLGEDTCSNAQKTFLDGKFGIPESTSTTTPVIISTTVVLGRQRLQTDEAHIYPFRFNPPAYIFIYTDWHLTAT